MTINRHVLPVEDGQLPLTVARAAGTGVPVVIMPSAFGVGPDLEAQMDELGRDATVVVTLDPFFRQDAGPAPYEDMGRVMGRIQALDRERAYRDLRAVIGWAREQAGGRAPVLLGICLGGAYAFMAAAGDALSGVVTWHGTRLDAFVDRAAEMRCPMRLHFGGADPFVKMDAVEKVRQAFASRPDVRLFVHEGATHGFSHRGAAAAYQAAAEQAGMESVRELVNAAR